MDNFTLLALIALTNVLIHFAFRRVYVSTAEKRDRLTDESIARGEPNAENAINSSPIFIPRMLARWPWPRQINPHYATVEKESNAWIASFHPFNPRAQDAYYRCNFPLVGCLFYPTLNKVHARAGCDVMHVFFVFDEYSDRSSPSEVRNQKNIIMDALRDPHKPRPKGEWIGGEVTRQFWELTVRNASKSMQKRFIQGADEYLEGVIQESVNKRDHRVLDVKSYFELRRCTVAAKVLFAMVELEVDIPDEVASNPEIQEITQVATDIILLCNDVVSYNMEQMRGDHIHNVITSVMHEHDTDINGAILWVTDRIFTLCQRYLDIMASLTHWEEPLGSKVKAYCEGIAHVVRGNYEWSFESERYLGTKGMEVKKNRWTSILPKKGEHELGPVHIDASLL